MTSQLTPTEIVVGTFRYTRRDYTPKRRGEPAGHGWYREGDHRVEVGLEAKVLIDEIARLREENEVPCVANGWMPS